MTNIQLFIHHGWKSILAMSILVASVGFTIQSIQSAQAQSGPTVSYGSNPHKAYYGNAPSGVTPILTTNSETFIITGVSSDDGDDLSVQVDGTTAIPASSLDEKKTYNQLSYSGYSAYSYGYARANLFLTGNAHLPIEPGSTLQVNCANANGCFYYLEGYFAH